MSSSPMLAVYQHHQEGRDFVQMEAQRAQELHHEPSFQKVKIVPASKWEAQVAVDVFCVGGAALYVLKARKQPRATARLLFLVKRHHVGSTPFVLPYDTR